MDPAPALTSLQQGMVNASLRAPGEGLYIVQDVCVSLDPLNLDLLRESWLRIAQRHSALRLFAGERREYEWRELDWSDLQPEESSGRLESLLLDDRRRGFSFQGPLARFTVVRGPGRADTLIWTSHHALLDGRSYLTVWREWFALYDGEPERLSQPLQRIEPPDLAAAEQFWRGHLSGFPQTTGYVVERAVSRSPADGELFRSEALSFTEATTSALTALAQSLGATLNNLVQAAWALLLSRYSGRDDIVFGVTRTGRPRWSLQDAETVGLQMNTVPFRIGVRPETTLADWLRQIRAQWDAMRPFSQAPLEQIRSWTETPAGAPLFESVLVYDHEPPGESLRKLGGHWERRSVRRHQRIDAPLALVGYGAPRLALRVVYDARLFSRDTIVGLIQHLETLLGEFLSHPDSPLGALRIVSPEEERQLFSGSFTELRSPLAGASGVHRLFEQMASRQPDKIALEDGSLAISYAELNACANRMARVLLRQGVRTGDLVPLTLRRSAEAVVSILAALKAGAAFLPVDSDLPSERRAAALAALGVRPLSLPERPFDAAGVPEADLDDQSGPNDLAYAIFTSGSTGAPKAVAVTHSALINHTLAAPAAFGITASDRRLQFASLSSDVFIGEVFTYLCAGATLVFCERSAGISPADFLRQLDEKRITITGLPATWWSEWVAYMASTGSALPPSLRAVVAGMEAVSPAAFETWKKLAGHRVRWFNAYGPAEACPTSTVYEAGTSPWEGGSFLPIGKPLANVRVYVLDRNLQLLPDGVAGELCIGGAGVARGYRNAPELTAAKFIEDPFCPGSKMYRTGDAAFRLPDGNFVFVGRLDRQVKIRGYRVDLDEVENALALCPGVRQCAVVPDGPGLSAWLTAEGVVTLEQIRLHLLRRLPAHMIPGAFFVLDEMPRTATAKIDRQSLARCPAVRLRPAGSPQAPTNETEMRLAALWREALKLDQVGVADDFFELGGDSLAATVLITLIQEEFGVALPFAALVRSPSVAALAAVLQHDLRSAPRQPVSPLQPAGDRIPFFAIQCADYDLLCFRRLSRRLGPHQPFFSLDSPLWRDGRLQTVEEIADHAARLILAAQPAGPLLVGGFCFGGVVAFETARQLRAAARDVRLVVMFDASRPGLIPDPARYLRQAPRLLTAKFAWRELADHAAFLRKLAARRSLAALNRALRGAGRKPIAAASLPLGQTLERSATMYVARPLDVPVLQFLAADEPMTTRVLSDPRLEWSDVCRAGFTVYHISGEHSTWFLEPHVAKVSSKLSELLAALNGAHPHGSR